MSRTSPIPSAQRELPRWDYEDRNASLAHLKPAPLRISHRNQTSSDAQPYRPTSKDVAELSKQHSSGATGPTDGRRANEQPMISHILGPRPRPVGGNVASLLSRFESVDSLFDLDIQGRSVATGRVNSGTVPQRHAKSPEIAPLEDPVKQTQQGLLDASGFHLRSPKGARDVGVGMTSAQTPA
jgi:hypothetical protein